MLNTMLDSRPAYDAVPTAYRPAANPIRLARFSEWVWRRSGLQVRPHRKASDAVQGYASMRTSNSRSADNELYDRGCDLVAAATTIRQVAGSPGAARAVPAVLGCIEAALRELTEAAEGLELTTDAADTLGAKSERMHRGYANLRRALEDAERAAAAARPLASRVLAQTAGTERSRRARG